jgi:hypothetical protein
MSPNKIVFYHVNALDPQYSICQLFLKKKNHSQDQQGIMLINFSQVNVYNQKKIN